MPEFNGFQLQDFDNLEGSTWRSRERLGGVLAAALRRQLGRPYQSWGVRRRLSKLPEDQWVDPHIFTTIDKEKAIGMGADVVGPILTVLRALSPVYEMTIAR